MLEQIIEAAVGFLVLLPLGTWLEKKLDREMEEDKK